MIKRIHPDLYQSHGEEVSATNKRCVQNLYELAEFLRMTDDEYKDNAGKGQQNGRVSPLRTSYCMDFFVENERNETGGDLKEISTEIKPNKALCEPTILKSNKLDIAVQNLKMQLGQVYVKAGLLDPLKRKSMDWATAGRRGGSSGKGRRRDRGAGGIDVAEIDRIIYERIISKRNESIPVPATSKSKASISRMELEAETFLRSGSVLVQNMSPNDEVLALDRLRVFLVDYGTVLNLSSSSKWSALHVVIRDSADTKDMDSYSITTSVEKKRVVIEIPKDFKVAKLLKSLVSVAKEES